MCIVEAFVEIHLDGTRHHREVLRPCERSDGVRPCHLCSYRNMPDHYVRVIEVRPPGPHPPPPFLSPAPPPPPPPAICPTPLPPPPPPPKKKRRELTSNMRFEVDITFGKIRKVKKPVEQEVDVIDIVEEDIIAEDDEIIAIEEPVHPRHRTRLPPPGWRTPPVPPPAPTPPCSRGRSPIPPPRRMPPSRQVSPRPPPPPPPPAAPAPAPAPSPAPAPAPTPVRPAPPSPPPSEIIIIEPEPDRHGHHRRRETVVVQHERGPIRDSPHRTSPQSPFFDRRHQSPSSPFRRTERVIVREEYSDGERERRPYGTSSLRPSPVNGSPRRQSPRRPRFFDEDPLEAERRQMALERDRVDELDFEFRSTRLDDQDDDRRQYHHSRSNSRLPSIFPRLPLRRNPSASPSPARQPLVPVPARRPLGPPLRIHQDRNRDRDMIPRSSRSEDITARGARVLAEAGRVAPPTAPTPLRGILRNGNNNNPNRNANYGDDADVDLDVDAGPTQIIINNSQSAPRRDLSAGAGGAAAAAAAGSGGGLLRRETIGGGATGTRPGRGSLAGLGRWNTRRETREERGRGAGRSVRERIVYDDEWPGGSRRGGW